MKPIMDVNQIQKCLPHRPPFLLVDKIIEMEPKKRIVGVKNVTMNEPFFVGHFPGLPVMPGVLIIEALAQTCGVLALQEEDKKGKLAYFASIKEAKFRKPVVPGDTLILEIEVTNNRTRIVQCRGTAKVDGEVVAEADMMFGIMGEQKG
jgi:3-hydroxyacyl-[acyl-carrier-protein] dehydratase